MRDLSIHLSSYHNKVETSNFNYPSSNIVMTPDLSFAIPQQNTDHSSNHKRHRPSTLLTDNLTLPSALQDNWTDQSLQSSNFEAHGVAARPNSVPFDSSSPTLNSNLLHPQVEISSLVTHPTNLTTGVYDDTHQLLNDAPVRSSTGGQNSNTGAHNMLSPLNESQLSSRNGNDAVSLLLEELHRSQQP